ncbi:MAG: hypothetical protein LYZ69_01185 [Nitrososphaerales archaeon]|nr:hypothetical protein [Nitrososphaerales archaeon]
MAKAERRYWYTTFRMASYANTFGALIWTALMVLPFAPFSSVPPIMVAGGPGQWLVVAYLLFVTVGAGGFGWLSGLLHTIEVHEGRKADPSLMWPGFILLYFGVTSSCAMLAAAGTLGGYASTVSAGPVTPLREVLSPYVYPITATVLVAVAGAFLALLAMIRARGP